MISLTVSTTRQRLHTEHVHVHLSMSTYMKWELFFAVLVSSCSCEWQDLRGDAMIIVRHNTLALVSFFTINPNDRWARQDRDAHFVCLSDESPLSHCAISGGVPLLIDGGERGEANIEGLSSSTSTESGRRRGAGNVGRGRVRLITTATTAAVLGIFSCKWAPRTLGNVKMTNF